MNFSYRETSKGEHFSLLKKLKILICVNSFKGCLGSYEAGIAVQAGIHKANPKIQTSVYPVSDGGDGFMDAYCYQTKFKTVSVHIQSPIGEKMIASFSWIPASKTAVIESAKILGLALIPQEKRNALLASSSGLGIALKKAKKMGAKKIIIGLGGSATTDCGIGMLESLGYQFQDRHGNKIQPIGGQVLGKIQKIISPEKNPLSGISIVAAFDVKNYLIGKTGTALTYSMQKGASKKDALFLENGMIHFSKIAKSFLGKNIHNLPGSGAAGGLGGALYGFLDAELIQGSDFIIQHHKLDRKIKEYNLVITGEGSLDSQSVFGKFPAVISTFAKQNNIPVVCLSGSVGNLHSELRKLGITSSFSIQPGPISLNEAMQKNTTIRNLQKMGYELSGLIEALSGRLFHRSTCIKIKPDLENSRYNI